MLGEQPGDGVRAILTFRDRRITRALGARDRHRQFPLRHHKAGGRIVLAARDLGLRQLAGLDRARADDADRHFFIGDALHLEAVQFAKIADLLEGERRVVDQPNGRRLGHQGFRHTSSGIIPIRPARR